MNLHDFIQAGIEAKGSRERLADHLGIEPNNITGAKAHRRGLPNDACFKLAALLGVDAKDVIAASELATERKEAKRTFWADYMKRSQIGRIAGILIFLSTVTNFVTPNPAQAAPDRDSSLYCFCIM